LTFYYSDFGEFLIAISITAQQDPEKKLEWAFSMYGMYGTWIDRNNQFDYIYIYTLDIDRNGFIEKKEMKKIMDVRNDSIDIDIGICMFCFQAIFDLLGEERKGNNAPDLKVDQIFAKMDTNGDGKLSKEEFISGCLLDDYLRRLLAPSAS